MIHSELVVGAVISHHHVGTIPRAAHLDAEVVVSLLGQTAGTGGTLEQPLCQGDAGRHAIPLHLVNGHGRITVDVPLIER